MSKGVGTGDGRLLLWSHPPSTPSREIWGRDAQKRLGGTEGTGISPKIFHTQGSTEPPFLPRQKALLGPSSVFVPNRGAIGTHTCPAAREDVACHGQGGGAGTPRKGPRRAGENPFDLARRKLIPCCDTSTRCFLEELYWGTGLMLQLFFKVSCGLYPD